MYLKDLVKALGISPYQIQPEDNFLISGITSNSKAVKRGFVFVAIKGTHQNGESFIEEAVSRGAKAIIVHSSWFMVHGMGNRVIIKVKDTRRALANLAAKFYNQPSKDIKVIGVTGTNGKTTITYLVEHILSEAGFNPAVMGTVNYRFGGKVLPSYNTTPGPVELQSLLAQMRDNKVDYLIMEVSSHALSQSRTEGIKFNSAIFTNLTQDHLDYHKNFQDYFSCKAKLFKELDPRSLAITNIDDPYGKKLLKLTKAKKITYGIKARADFKAEDIEFGFAHTNFKLVAPNKVLHIKSRLIGIHNVYNILAGAAFVSSRKIDFQVIEEALNNFRYVPGRLERVNSSNGFSVFVDYAHTEDALKNVICALRQIGPRRIIVVFGCGGDRDKTKRPKMGRVVSSLADFSIITSDNPRSENPLSIIKDIRRGITKNNYSVIADRAEAIKKSLKIARKGDMVLIAGKGHENYQVFKDKTVVFDDKEVAKRCLKSTNY